MFQKWVLALLCCSLVMFQTDVIARGGGGSSFRSSSSSRGGWERARFIDDAC